jgi:hypothetical protein
MIALDYHGISNYLVLLLLYEVDVSDRRPGPARPYPWSFWTSSVLGSRVVGNLCNYPRNIFLVEPFLI